MQEVFTPWQRFCLWFCNTFCKRFMEAAYSSGRSAAFTECAPGYQGFFPAHALQSNIAESGEWRLDQDCFNRIHLCRRGQPVAWVSTCVIGMELFHAVADSPESKIMSILGRDFNCNEDRRALLNHIITQITPDAMPGPHRRRGDDMTQLWCIGCDAFFDKRDDVRGEDYFIDRDGECWCADCWEDRKRAKRTAQKGLALE